MRIGVGRGFLAWWCWCEPWPAFQNTSWLLTWVLRVGSHLGRLAFLGTGTMVVCLKHDGITDSDRVQVENVSEDTVGPCMRWAHILEIFLVPWLCESWPVQRSCSHWLRRAWSHSRPEQLVFSCMLQCCCHVLTLVPLFVFVLVWSGRELGWAVYVCFSMLVFVFGLVWFSIRGKCR